ncbi:hypothetical protein LEP1GSC061_3807 [Leptospira wolffii serovar Khorat str. Khorat-H2]|nr:hypothetical protein LEP1GSC061_3807 [Leptospira wolffii serovar Khorat str. Khorat-H2]
MRTLAFYKFCEECAQKSFSNLQPLEMENLLSFVNGIERKFFDSERRD